MVSRHEWDKNGDMATMWNGKRPEEFTRKEELQFIIDNDLKLHGAVQSDVLQAIETSGYLLENGSLKPKLVIGTFYKDAEDITEDIKVNVERTKAGELVIVRNVGKENETVEPFTEEKYSELYEEASNRVLLGKSGSIVHERSNLSYMQSEQPFVTILSSDHSDLKSGEKMSLEEAEYTFKELDSLDSRTGALEKVRFQIDYTFQGHRETYKGRYEFGNKEGGLLEHIQKFYHIHRSAPKAELVLNEIVPYFRMHCNLDKMERNTKRIELELKGKEPLANAERAEAAYCEAEYKYITECRIMLNRGEYKLPEAPRLESFQEPYKKIEKQENMSKKEQQNRKTSMAKDFSKSGYTLNQNILYKLEKLNSITNKEHGLKDIADAYKSGAYKENNSEAHKIIQDIGQELKTQELIQSAGIGLEA